MQKADNEKVYFYSPGKSSYYSNVTLRNEMHGLMAFRKIVLHIPSSY